MLSTAFRTWKRWWKVLAPAVCGVGLLYVLAGWSASGNRGPADAGVKAASPSAEPSEKAADIPKVRVTQPSRDKKPRAVSKFAYVEPMEQADLFAKAAGYLSEVRVDIGVRVKGPLQEDGRPIAAGELLAVLDLPEAWQDLIQKKALVEHAKAEEDQAKAAANAAEAMVRAAKAKVTETKAQIARYQAEMAYRESEERRFRSLLESKAIQKEQWEEKYNLFKAAEAARDAAKANEATAAANVEVEEARLRKAQEDTKAAAARVKVAEANRELAEVLWGYREIRAPFNGLITRRYKHPGDFIQSAASGRAEPLFTIVRTDNPRIVAHVPETDALWIHLGQAAVFHPDGPNGEKLTGKVARIADALDPSTRTMRVEVSLPNAPASLRPGVSGSCAITLLEPNTSWQLPASALICRDGKHYLQVANGSRAQLREIKLGCNDGSNIWVVTGIDDKQDVVLDGKTPLEDGQEIAIVR